MHKFPSRRRYTWTLPTRTLTLGDRTLLMGIVNVTPDSFSDGGRYYDPTHAIAHSLTLLDEGADLLDLGGESTRPNATPVTAQEEQRRILPVLTGILAGRPAAILSVDTYHASTAEAAVHAGAQIVNDVSGLHWDPLMPETLARLDTACILMHTRGRPTEWSGLPSIPPGGVISLIGRDLLETLRLAASAGIPRDRIVVDPGFGFGKRGAENLELHAGLTELAELGCPILTGTSRKRYLTAAFPNPTEAQREAATTASHVAAILAGAHILRVHDIPAAQAAARLADAILTAAHRDQ